MRDLLSDQHSAIGELVLNHGDPAFKSFSQGFSGLGASEEIFLRIISYIPFAETIILPGRHLIDGENAFEAAVLAKPLLKQGLVVPERRSGANSFSDVSKERGLGSLQRSRADYLDKHTLSVREFRWDELSATYRSILLEDLGSNGPFRRVVPGGLRGGLKTALDSALEVYARSGATTPEAFIHCVAQACPQAASLARKWAMARYYVTPTNFDDIHVRQIPREAADLLISGLAIDRKLRPTDGLAPAEHLAQQLSVGLGVDEVQRMAGAYCDAALRVRDDVPEARAVFASILNQAEARELGEEVTAAMRRELERQMRKKIVDGPVYSVGIDVLGGVTGAGLGLLGGPLVAIGLGVAGALAAGGLKHVAKDRYDKSARPWKLAIDQLETAVKNSSPKA